jgi:putative tryptophan/tyrosine transport system substrate-binding protein
MDRRRFLLTSLAGVLAAQASAEAQQAGRVPRVGWLGGGGGRSAADLRESSEFRALTAGLREHGRIVGQNVFVDVRTVPPGKVELYPDLAARFVAEGVDMILAANPFSLAAATKATKTIPIVGIDLESDPVAQGWAVALARPRGNVSGVFLDIPEMSGKHVQFLHEVKPDITRMAALGDPRVNTLQFEATEAAVRNGGFALERVSVRTPSEIEGAIAGAAHRGASALVALTSPLVNSSMPRIANAAVRHRMPSVCTFAPAFAEAGGLVAYGPDFNELYKRAADYVSRILKGTRPGDLPIQRPEKFRLVVNLRTAQALGLTIPPSLLARADHVIE